MMLAGQPPWKVATAHDEIFRIFSGGYLTPILTDHPHYRILGLSGDAIDILQRMLFLDPRDRISLQQVRDHLWMHGLVRNPMNNE